MYNDELMHYGVKGMKWGKRKARYDNSYSGQMRSAKAAYKQEKKRIDSEYTKAGERYDRATKGGRIESKKADDALDRAADKWGADRKSAKAAYKQQKSQIKDAARAEKRNMKLQSYKDAQLAMARNRQKFDDSGAWKKVEENLMKLNINDVRSKKEIKRAINDGINYVNNLY